MAANKGLLMNKFCTIVFILLNCFCLDSLVYAAVVPETASPTRDITFLATSDSHYDAFEKEDRNDRNRDTILEMNAINERSWPESLGGERIQQPMGLMILGDVIDDGDRILNGKHQTPRQWRLFEADFGLDGRDGLINYPVYETWGNHDGPPVSKEKNGFSFQAQLKRRHLIRQQNGMICNLSPNGLHVSWDWDDVHFVQLGIYPADRQHPDIRYNSTWHDPQNALTFLKNDLAQSVGQSGSPIVLMSHCGFDADWWHKEDMKTFYESVKDYNVVLYLYGHSGTGLRQWAPPGQDKSLQCINTGQTENGFFTIQIKNNTVRAAYRQKNYINETDPTGKPTRKWDGTWKWNHILDKKVR
jgi:cytolysin (calcineurin-like family phosphatase)